MTPQERFDEKWTRDPSTGCYVWTAATDRDGYGQFKYDGKSVRAHRWVWEQSKSSIPDDLVVRHVTCSNPSCVNIWHLAVGTHGENAEDRDRDGNTARGSDNGRAKITESEVREIRRRYDEENITQQALAEEYGLSRSVIGRIIRRELWAHVD